MAEKVTLFAYVAIAVKNLENARDFFADKFGGTIIETPGLESEGYRDVFVKIGNFRLYLMEPTTKESVIAKYLDKHGEGIHHICFKYEDYDEAISELRESNLKILDRDSEDAPYSFIHPKDAFGVLIELAPLSKYDKM